MDSFISFTGLSFWWEVTDCRCCVAIEILVGFFSTHMDWIKQATHLTGLDPLPSLEILENRAKQTSLTKRKLRKPSDCWPNPDDLDFDQTLMIWTTSNWICIQVFLASFKLNFCKRLKFLCLMLGPYLNITFVLILYKHGGTSSDDLSSIISSRQEAGRSSLYCIHNVIEQLISLIGWVLREGDRK